MKNIKKGLIVAAGLLLAPFCTTNVFADNPYGIEYSGGEVLGAENVQIDSDLVESLTPLMQVGGNMTVTTSNSNRIADGYLFSGSGVSQCRAVKYVTVSNNNLVNSDDGISFSFTQGQYAVSVAYKNIILENVSNEKTYAVAMDANTSYLYTGYQIYEDAACRTTVSGLSTLGQDASERIFVDMIIKVHNATSLSAPIVLDNLYFALTDIDRAQSYKILNVGNTLEKSRMYAKSAADLQGQAGDLRNMYVPDGDYIYSEYSTGMGGVNSLDLQDTANVYTALSNQTQEDGLNIVLGFVAGAYNGIEFYVSEETIENVRVNYVSDDHGTITGRRAENVAIDGSPSGSTSTASEGYEFAHWIANKNVRLKDNTTVEAGQPLTNAQVLNIVVTEDITLTAIHEAIVVPDEPDEPEPEPEPEEEPTPVAPETGMNSGRANAMIATISVFGIMLGAFFVKLLPRFTRKKVDFDK